MPSSGSKMVPIKPSAANISILILNRNANRASEAAIASTMHPSNYLSRIFCNTATVEIEPFLWCPNVASSATKMSGCYTHYACIFNYWVYFINPQSFVLIPLCFRLSHPDCSSFCIIKSLRSSEGFLLDLHQCDAMSEAIKYFRCTKMHIHFQINLNT